MKTRNLTKIWIIRELIGWGLDWGVRPETGGSMSQEARVGDVSLIVGKSIVGN